MRDGSDLLEQALLDSFAVRLVVDVFYDDERVFVNLPVVDWRITSDAESTTKTAVSVTVVYQGDRGDSLVPTGWTDVLAPYGQEFAILAKISCGPVFTETVMLGRFPLTGAPQGVNEYFGFAGRPYVIGSTIPVNAADRLAKIARDGFRWPAVPSHTDSTWDELQAISGLPVDPNLPDLPTPANFVYQPGRGGRLQAIQQLMSYLGGVAVTNSDGELTALPYAAGDPVHVLTMGTRGVVDDVQSGMDAETFVNEIVGTYQDADNNPIYAWASVTAGPLAITAPCGRSSDTDSSDTVTTLEAARQRVRDVLTQRLQGQTNRVTLTVTFDPRTETGDVVTVQGPRTRFAQQLPDGRTAMTGCSNPAWEITGRVVSIDWAGSSDGKAGAQMAVVLDLAAPDMQAAISVGP